MAGHGAPSSPELLVLPDLGQAAAAAAGHLAARLALGVELRGRAVLAVSGGGSASPLLIALADAAAVIELPWSAVHVVQVDERVAPDGHPDRNAVGLVRDLVRRVPLPSTNVHLMDVGGRAGPASVADDVRLAEAAQRCATSLHRLAPDGIDAVHLGLGEDGHTASLVPGDPVLDVTDRAVAVTGTYQGRRRLTLTYPELRRARSILWFVTGAGKRAVLPRLLAHDPAIPAGRLVRGVDLVVADAAAAGGLQPGAPR